MRGCTKILAAIAPLLFVCRCGAVETITSPFLGVQHIQIVESVPRPLFINITSIDMTALGLSFRLTPPDPNPPTTNGVQQEVLTRTVRQYVDQQDAQVGVNMSFFTVSDLTKSVWTNDNGLAVSDGTKYSPWDANGETGFNVSAANVLTAISAKSSRPTGYETNPTGISLYNAVRARDHLLTNGVLSAPARTTDGGINDLNARTAVGLAPNKLLLMTVDGSQAGFSEGMYMDEEATTLQSFGATNVYNYDGGGSSTMAYHYYNDAAVGGNGVGGVRLINSSTGTGPINSERYVGTSLAVFAAPNPSYIAPQAPPPKPAGVVTLDDFETNEGHFASSASASGSNVGIDSADSSLNRVINDGYYGEASQRIVIRSSNPVTPGTAFRNLSGGGTPSSNTAVGNKGWIGYFLKVLSTDTITAGDLKASILMDDGSGTEQGTNQSVIDDGAWHLYQWNLADATSWDSFSSGNGQIDSTSATVDSVYFSSALNLNVEMYFDTLAFNPNGNLNALVPEPTSLAVGSFAILLLFRRRFTSSH